MIDRFTRWPEAIPLAQTDAASVDRAFELHWVARFGVPSDITSDRGAQFTSDMWKALAESLGAKIHHTTAYHPQANGLVERFHRSLKAALRARLTTTAWMDELPWVMLGLRTMPKEDMGSVGSRNGLWNTADGIRNIRQAEQQPGRVRTSTTHAGT